MSGLTSRRMGSQVFLYLSCPQVVSFALYNFIYSRVTGNYTNKKTQDSIIWGVSVTSLVSAVRP